MVHDNIESLLLPYDVRLLYIGPMKTGTTTIQAAAQKARDKMYQHGTYYPGTSRNHRIQINAALHKKELMLAGRPITPGQTKSELWFTPPESEWQRLLDDIYSEPPMRTLISHEFAASASDEQAYKLARQLGTTKTHIAITLRPIDEILISHWVEKLKVGLSDTFDDWLQKVLDKDNTSITANLRRQIDQSALIDRWAKIVGPTNVTVIIANKSDRDFSTKTFEEMLGLPQNTLTGTVTSGRLTNRSMTLLEANTIRKANEYLHEGEQLSWHVYREVVQRGALYRLLDRRHETANHNKVQIPKWAADAVQTLADKHTEQIAKSGTRIVGDLSSLAVVRNIQDTSDPSINQNNDIATELLTGAVYGAMHYERQLAKIIRQTDRNARRNAKAAQTPVNKMSLTSECTVPQALRNVPKEKLPETIATNFSLKTILRAITIQCRRKARSIKTTLGI